MKDQKTLIPLRWPRWIGRRLAYMINHRSHLKEGHMQHINPQKNVVVESCGVQNMFTATRQVITHS